MSDQLADARRKYPDADWFIADVHLRRNSDGLVRVCEDVAIRDGWRYQWADGNYSCDCNRQLFFERAGGGDPDTDDVECGDGAFSVVKIVDRETDAVLCDGEPASFLALKNVTDGR